MVLMCGGMPRDRGEGRHEQCPAFTENTQQPVQHHCGTTIYCSDGIEGRMHDDRVAFTKAKLFKAFC
jgi:hypothetical protein